MSWLFIRALVAFLVLPGTIGFFIPLWLIDPRAEFQAFRVSAWPIVAVGLALLLWCVREFFVAGRGTLAPWSPPQHLVVSGPYRLSRSPMYVAVSLVLWGWALGFRSTVLAVYAIVVMIGFHLRVVMAEEPWLARTFGGEWTRYRARVRRWI